MHATHMSKIKIIKTIGTFLVISLAIIFFTKTLTEYYQQLQTSLFSISPLRVVASFLLFIGYLYLRALSWRSLIHFLGENVNKTNSLSVWFFSEATRYIPGNVWAFASRAYLARQIMVSKNVSFLVLPVEVLTVTAVTSLLSLYAVINNLERLPVNSVFYVAILSPLFMLLGFLILQKIIKRVVGKLLSLELNPPAYLKAVLFQLACWSLYSAGTLVLIDGKIDFLLFSSTILAWLVGYLSLVTPMGLGVRESAFVLLVGEIIGTPQSLVVAIISRVILIVAEMAILAFLSARNKFAKD